MSVPYNNTSISSMKNISIFSKRGMSLADIDIRLTEWSPTPDIFYADMPDFVLDVPAIYDMETRQCHNGVDAVKKFLDINVPRKMARVRVAKVEKAKPVEKAKTVEKVKTVEKPVEKGKLIMKPDEKAKTIEKAKSVKKAETPVEKTKPVAKVEKPEEKIEKPKAKRGRPKKI